MAFTDKPIGLSPLRDPLPFSGRHLLSCPCGHKTTAGHRLGDTSGHSNGQWPSLRCVNIVVTVPSHIHPLRRYEIWPVERNESCTTVMRTDTYLLYDHPSLNAGRSHVITVYVPWAADHAHYKFWYKQCCNSPLMGNGRVKWTNQLLKPIVNDSEIS